jgi:phosphoadenosine phosphosulfate reductase
MTTRNLQAWREDLQDLPPQEILRWAAARFPGKLTLATALGPEAQILTHFIATHELDIPIFTIDTGRLFNETHELIQRTNETYGITIKVVFPEHRDVEEMVNEHGPNLFLKNRELRKRCCVFRKVMPLQRVMAGYDAWLTGLRKDQSVTRQDARVIEWDAKNDLFKINPLVNWTTDQVWDFIAANDVPYNRLHDQGYPSIGCAPCTRAVAEGEDNRAGRWWWEQPEHRECGIHIVDGKVTRKRVLIAV